jgi:hypothetical protein
MEPTDLTIQVLQGIREEVRNGLHEVRSGLHEVRTGLEATNTRLDETNVRLDRLERRQVEGEIRVSTHLVAVVGAVNEVRDVLRDELGLRRQVEDHERRLRAVEARQP